MHILTMNQEHNIMFIISNFSVKKTPSHSTCPEINTAETRMLHYVKYFVIIQTAEPNLLLHSQASWHRIISFLMADKY